MFDMAKSLGVVDENGSHDVEVFEVGAYGTGQCPLSRDQVDTYYEFVDPLMDKYENMAERKNADLSRSIGELYDNDYAKFLQASE